MSPNLKWVKEDSKSNIFLASIIVQVIIFNPKNYIISQVLSFSLWEKKLRKMKTYSKATI